MVWLTKSKFLSLVLLLEFFFVTKAHSLTMTFTDKPLENVYLSSAGESYTGHFDINQSLKDYNKPYTIESALVSFHFLDDRITDLDLRFTNELDYKWKNYWTTSVDGLTHYHNLYQKDIFNTYVDEYEWVVARTESYYGSIYSSYYWTDYSEIGTIFDREEIYNGNGYVTHNYYYTKTFEKVSGGSGSMTIDFPLTAYDLTGLSLDGLLNYQVYAYQGDLFFSEAQLKLTLLEDTLPSPTPIPEPQPFYLVGIGLLCMVGYRKYILRKNLKVG